MNKATDIRTSTFKISLYLLVLFSAVFFSLYAEFKNEPNRIQRIEFQYADDFSNDNILVGASQNIFIGKITAIAGSKDLGLGPETQYTVEVVDNIKGLLKGNITLDQIGGYKNGELYVVSDDVSSEDSKDQSGYLLKVGSTYLFATRYNKTQNWYTLNPYPTASKLLSSDSNVSDEQLKSIAESDQRFQQLKAAYPNEILLKADIKNGNTKNSYQSLQQVDKALNQDTATSTN